MVVRPGGMSAKSCVSRAMRALAVGALGAACWAGVVSAAPKHGLSIFGDLKYPADFQHFDYVNPNAPKGGRVAQVGSGSVTTYDSFNA